MAGIGFSCIYSTLYNNLPVIKAVGRQHSLPEGNTPSCLLLLLLNPLESLPPSYQREPEKPVANNYSILKLGTRAHAHTVNNAGGLGELLGGDRIDPGEETGKLPSGQ